MLCSYEGVDGDFEESGQTAISGFMEAGNAMLGKVPPSACMDYARGPMAGGAK